MEATCEHDRAWILDTCHRVLPIADAVEGMFYGRLFSLCPESRAWFDPDPRERLDQLVSQLASVASSALRGQPCAIDTCSACVVRPMPEGVRRIADESLIWALEQALGSTFGQEGRAAFVRLCSARAGAEAPDRVEALRGPPGGGRQRRSYEGR